MSKAIKRLLAVIGVIFGLFILTAILVPILFKDKIMALVKKELNEQINATADFKDVSISLFRHFPHLAVGVDGLTVVNKAPFEGDSLVSAKRIDLSLDLMKAIKGNYDIISIDIDEPRIHALVNDKGLANWNITKPDTTTKTSTAPSKPFQMKLRHYAINKAYVEYRDEQGKMYLTIRDLTHSGSGDFSSDAFTLSTKTQAEAITFISGNIPYLSEVKTLIDMDLQVESRANKYSFSTDKIQLNGLKLSTKGFVQLPDTLNTVMDIQFSTPSNDFKDILSLVPGVYQSNFKDIKTTGKATLNGFVKGTYNAKQLPAYQLNLLVQDGSFQYPDLPEKVADIQIKMQVNNPDGVTDHTVVNIEKGHLALGAAPFDFRLLLKTPTSNPWIDATAKGKLDLSQVQKFTKLAAGTKLSGMINADVAVKGSIAAAQKQQYEALNAAGSIGVSNLLYVSKDYPDGVSIVSLLMTFNPKNVTVSGLKGSAMQTNFSGAGSINNLLGYYFHKEPLNGSLHVAVDKVDVNKWMGTPSNAQEQTAAKPAANAQPFLVPDNLDFTLTAEAGSVKYDNLNLSNVKGTVTIKDQAVLLQNVSGNALDGSLKIDGAYSTKNDKKNPDIAFSYNVQKLDVQKTFSTFNTVQKLMPVAKYIAGKMSSQMSMQGKLDGNMSPVMNTLSGKGDVEVMDAMIGNFPPLDKIADKLNMAQLKKMQVHDLKTSFSFENGRVTVKPYTYKVGDVSMEIAGSHGFDQTIQYGINMTVPRSALGAQGNAVVNNLVSQAASKGVPVQVGDKVNLAVNIGGTITNPKVETNLKNVVGDAVNNVKQQLSNEAQKRIDSAKTLVKDTVKAIKNQVVNEAKNQIMNQLNGGKDTSKNNTVKDVKDKATNAAKDALNGLFHKK